MGGQLSDEELFRHLHLIIKRERLFLDPDFDRQQLIDRVHLPAHRVGAAFSQGSEFDSLPDFIRDCRLEYARELIVSRPDLTFSEIVDASGFLHATTFSVDFKHKYGLTPTQYREQNV